MKKVSEPTGSILFEEKQAFPRWLQILMLSLLPAIMIVILVLSRYTETDRTEMIVALITVGVVTGLNFWMFYYVRFEKIVTRDGFYYRWKPIQKKYRVLGKADILNHEFRNPPLNIGYGFYPGYGIIHNMSYNQGWQVELRNGKRRFFGSADPFLFERAIREFFGRGGAHPQTTKP